MAKTDREIVEELRAAYKNGWEPTVEFVLWAARQRTTPKETNAEVLEKALDLRSADLHELLKGIADIGIGTRIIGRHGAKTRIVWHYTLASIGNAALGDASKLERTEDSNFSPSSKNAKVEHIFQLRPGSKVKFSLPADLTEVEARRLSKFIEALPFASSE